MTYTLELNQQQIEQLIQTYQTFQIDSIHNYTLFRGKIKSTTLTIYRTGKVLLQGNDCDELCIDICNLLNIPNTYTSTNPQIMPKPIKLGQSIIGSDEVGTGDYFGGIVVCSSFVPKDKILSLHQLGIRDSKELTDIKITELATKIIQIIPHSVLLLSNEKYNSLINHEFNMNKIKAILHSKVIHNLLIKYQNKINYERIIVDGFCTKELYLSYLNNIDEIDQKLEMIEKAENQFAAVACSSIIARYYFLKNMKALSEESGYPLPKGAGCKVDAIGKKIYKEKGEKFLSKYAKMNFKNTIKIKMNKKEDE